MGNGYAYHMIDLHSASRDDLIRLIIASHETIAQQERTVAELRGVIATLTEEVAKESIPCKVAGAFRPATLHRVLYGFAVPVPVVVVPLVAVPVVPPEPTTTCPRISPFGKSPGPLSAVPLPSFVWTLTYALPLRIALRRSAIVFP